ncbi:hypothetical protein [Clostridium sp. KNHs214]|uniref:hypothetical protein n=1 Tax=Clostridium sp. KNHs214 TaxID=1540257 RepID=UPI00054F571C|nr:hypothetical protein [Clostridium sp. KNHs214]
MGSLSYQVKNKLKQMFAYKKSKRDYKLENNIKLSSIPCKIYSRVTLQNYVKWGRNYVEWVKETKSNFKNLEDIPLSYAKEYLDYGVNVKGYSVYTTRLQASAISKLYNVPIKSFYKVPSIATAKIKRSRGVSAMDAHFSVENNKEFINFCKGTGLRRKEVTALKPEQIVIKNNKVYIDLESKREYNVQTKGGRPRIVEVLPEYYSVVLKAKKNATGNAKVFSKIPKNADIHSYRRFYAKTKYQQFLKNKFGSIKNAKMDYFRRGKNKGKHYNRAALQHVSVNMGHNRLIVVFSYL